MLQWNIHLGRLLFITEAPKPSKNWALWVNILLMLYDFNNDIHIADETFVLSTRENDPLSLENSKRYQALESADFNIVKFNSAGQVLFDPYYRHSMLVGECALNTGQVLIARFCLVGTHEGIHRVRLLGLFDPYMRIQALGKSVEDQMGHFQSNMAPDDPEHWLKEEE
jgi:hypothetical protein